MNYDVVICGAGPTEDGHNCTCANDLAIIASMDDDGKLKALLNEHRRRKNASNANADGE